LKRHNPFQNLINWFKENFKNREYQKEFKKARSPRVKQNVPDTLASMGIGMPGTQKPDGGDWENINNDWVKPTGGNSVHSMNDD
jgi:hypothetical protein